MTGASGRGDPERLAEEISAAVLQHPAVHDLHGGAHGVIATYLPGRRLVGVRVTDTEIEVAVVLRLGHPVPDTIDALRERIRHIAGDMRVDLTVADLFTGESEHSGDSEGATGRSGTNGRGTDRETTDSEATGGRGNPS